MDSISSLKDGIRILLKSLQIIAVSKLPSKNYGRMNELGVATVALTTVGRALRV
jgi:hypothetical protein